MVLSVDSKVLKVWKNDSTASTFASIEPGQTLNGLCLVPRTGKWICMAVHPLLLAT